MAFSLFSSYSSLISKNLSFVDLHPKSLYLDIFLLADGRIQEQSLEEKISE